MSSYTCVVQSNHLVNSLTLLRLQEEAESLRQLQNPSSSNGNDVGRGWSGITPTLNIQKHRDRKMINQIQKNCMTANVTSDTSYFGLLLGNDITFMFFLNKKQKRIATRNIKKVFQLDFKTNGLRVKGMS